MRLTKYEPIKTRLEELRDAGKIDECTRHTIIDMSNKVLENIAQNYDNVRKGVHDVMGGQVLEYETKTIFNEGRTSEKKALTRRLYKRHMPLEEIVDIIQENLDVIQEWLDESED